MKTKDLLRIGTMMSNVCFNLAQSELTPEVFRKTMKSLQEQWDAAVRETTKPRAAQKRKTR